MFNFRLVKLGLTALPSAIYCVPVKFELDRICTLIVEDSLPLYDQRFQFRCHPGNILGIGTYELKGHYDVETCRYRLTEKLFDLIARVIFSFICFLLFY